MNFKTLLMPMAATLLLVGCTNEDELDPNKGQSGEPQYLSVKLVTAETRATEDASNYEDGTGAENTVSNVRFYFFDGEGKAAAVKGTSSVNWMECNPGGGAGETPNVEKTLQATLIIESPKGDKLPASVIAIVNPSGLGAESMSRKDLLDKVDNYNIGDTQGYSKTDSFVMSNAVYADGTNKVVDINIDGHIFPTSDAALANPVTIHVERVLAKVALGLDPAFTGAANVKTLSDGTKLYPALKQGGGQHEFDGKPLYVKFLGWSVTYNTKSSRLIKEINPAWASNLLGNSELWNYAPFFRSFWAVNPAMSADSYAKYDFDKDPEGANMNKNFTSGCVYIQENASDSFENGTNASKPTKVIIAAQLCDETGAPVEFAEWGFQKYAIENEGGLKDVMANSCDIYKTNAGGTGRVKIDASDIVFKTATNVGHTENGRYWVYAQIDESKSLTLFDRDGNAMSLTTANNKLLNLGHAKVWTSGKTYYYFDIAHLGNAIGIVRNHVYRANIKSLTGLGTPVYDPDEVIDPEKPGDEDTFVAAEIKILSWRIVNSDVNLDW